MVSRQSHALPVLGLILLGMGCAHGLGKDKLFAAFSNTPSNVRVTFPTEPCGANALVEWTAPPKDIFVETYVVKCESLDDRVIDIVDGDTTSLVIGPLELNSTYICYVAARTKFHGTSKAASSDPFSTERYVRFLASIFRGCCKALLCCNIRYDVHSVDRDKISCIFF